MSKKTKAKKNRSNKNGARKRRRRKAPGSRPALATTYYVRTDCFVPCFGQVLVKHRDGTWTVKAHSVDCLEGETGPERPDSFVFEITEQDFKQAAAAEWNVSPAKLEAMIERPVPKAPKGRWGVSAELNGRWQLFPETDPNDEPEPPTTPTVTVIYKPGVPGGEPFGMAMETGKIVIFTDDPHSAETKRAEAELRRQLTRMWAGESEFQAADVVIKTLE